MNNITVKIDLNWPSYEDDINAAVKSAILDEVRKEVRAQSAAIRAEVARQMGARNKELVERAMKALGQ